MSRWGLRYKGTEILTPSEWNAVVDALEDLDTRIACGVASFSGDGTTTEFMIEHGMATTPSSVVCGKRLPGLPDIDYWDVDDLYITVVFKEPPPSGTNNVQIWWIAVVKPGVILPSP